MNPAVSARDVLPAIGPTAADQQAARAFDFLLGVLTGEPTPNYTAPALTALGIPAGGAGYTIVRFVSDHNDGSYRRGVFLRYPQLDDLDTYSAHLYIACQHSTTNVQSGYVAWARVFDLNPFDTFSTWISQLISIGMWTNNTASAPDASGWPTGGQPNYQNTSGNAPEYNGGSQNSYGGQLVFTGNQPYDLIAVASAYGLKAIGNASTPNDSYAESIGREFDYVRLGRSIAAEGRLTSGSWSPGLDLGEIVGGGTFPPVSVANPFPLVIEVEGQSFPIDFPMYAGAGSFLYNASRFCQRVNQIGQGFFEAVIVDDLPPNEVKVAIRIPPTRPPVGEYSLDRPRVRIMHQDDALSINFGLSFAVEIAAYYSPVLGGASNFPSTSTLTPASPGLANFPFWVKAGFTLYNRDQDQYATVVGFATTTLQDDTLIFDPPQAGWVNGDDVLILPSYDHATGVSGHGGCWQATQDGAPATHVTDGASLDVMLSDYHGEAFRHFQVNQMIQVANNAQAFTSVVANVVGTDWKRGDRFRCTLGTGLGSEGIIRDVVQAGATLANGDTIIAEITKGASGNATPYKVAPLVNTDTITKLDFAGALTATTQDISSRDTSDPNPAVNTIGGAPLGTREIGNVGYAKITAITQWPNAASGDYRTRVTLALNGVNVNPNLILFPSFFVGLRPKYQFFRNYTPSSGGVMRMHPAIFDVIQGFQSGVDERDQGLNNIRRDLFGSPPVREPAHETGTLGSQLVEALITSPGHGADRVGPLPHSMGVNARGAAGSPNTYDRLEDCGNSNIPWLPYETHTSSQIVAGVPGSTVAWMCIGPGLNIQFP